MKLRNILALLVVVFMVSCGGEEKKPASTTKVKKAAVKKAPKKATTSTKTANSELIDLDNKGIGPVKSLELPTTIDQAMADNGQKIFKNKCSSCHATDLFTDQTYRNNGLSVNPKFNDKGRFDIFENPDDLYKFKVPSLRNIEKTFPYMHDGRFSTLEAVLTFYNEGAVDNGNVDESLRREDDSFGISLTDYEQESIIAFLKTLTDYEFLEDEKFAEF